MKDLAILRVVRRCENPATKRDFVLSAVAFDDIIGSLRHDPAKKRDSLSVRERYVGARRQENGSPEFRESTESGGGSGERDTLPAARKTHLQIRL